MASASSLPSNEARPRQADLAFLAVAMALGTLCAWLLKHGYLNEEALSLYEKIVVLSGAHPARLEYLGLVYPHLPAYLVWLLHEVPGLGTAATPYLAGVLMASLAMARWFKALAQKSGNKFAWLAISALSLHPFFLSSATASTEFGLSILLFYVVGEALVEILEKPSSQAFMRFSGLLALFFFADERASYVVLALVPLVPLFAPRTILERAPLALYLLVFTPFAMAFMAWAYLNWLYLGNAWHFLESPDSAFLGAFADAPFVPWLKDCGQQFWRPLFVTLAMTLAAFPVLFWQVGVSLRAKRTAAFAIVLGGAVVLATALGTFNDFLAHPVQMLYLLLPVVMVEMVHQPPVTKAQRVGVLVCLLLGSLGGWGAFLWDASPGMHDWMSAALGHTLPPAHLDDVALGRWLAVNRQRTLLDDQLAYPAIIARGDTQGLVLPYSSTFKLKLAQQVPDIDQIAVPDPDRGQGGQDLVNRRYPDLYAKGMPDFALVYDHLGWRVYRREAALQ